jgi:hypothetical protein
MLPDMNKSEQEAFRRALHGCNRYAEYGAGGSTCVAYTYPLASLVSVESDPLFVDRVRTLCPTADVRWIDIGPIRGYGHPTDESMRHAWPSYSDQDLADPDIVLVDGRFRVACCVNVLLRYPDATLLVHDFPMRTEYHAILPFVHIRSTTDTLVTLQKREGVNDDELRQLYSAYAYEQS